jgi:signal transduction histidine kinase/CheY-like chemotaxis protein
MHDSLTAVQHPASEDSTAPVRPLVVRLLGSLSLLLAVAAGTAVAVWSSGAVRTDVVVLATVLRESRSRALRGLAALVTLAVSWSILGVTWSATACVLTALAVAAAAAWSLAPRGARRDALPSARFAVVAWRLAVVVVVGSLVEAAVVHVLESVADSRFLALAASCALPLAVGVLGAGLVAGRVVLDRRAEPYAVRLSGAFAALALAGIAAQVTVQYWVSAESQQLTTAAATVSASLQQAVAGDLNSFSARAATVPRTPITTQAAFDRSMRSFVYGNPSISAAALIEGQGGAYHLVWATDRQGSAPEIGPLLGSAAADAPALDAAAATSTVMLLGVRDVPGADASPAPNLVYITQQSMPDGAAPRFLAVALSIPVALDQATVSLGPLRQNLVLQLTEPATDANANARVMATISSSVTPEEEAALEAQTTAVRSETMFGDVPLDLTVLPGHGFGVPMVVRAGVLSGLGLLGLLGAALVLQAANARHRSMREREEREGLLEAALDAAPGLVLLVDDAGRVLVSNGVGDDGERRVGMPVLDVLPFDTQGRTGAEIQGLLERARAGEPCTLDHVDTTSDSALRIQHVSVTAVPSSTTLVVQVEDITEERARSMRAAQSERLRSLGTMAGGLAHDFNNLLFIISGYLQMLREDDAITEHAHLQRYVDRASDASERGAEIASSLLSVARSQPLEATAVEVGSFLTRLYPLVRQAIGNERKVELEVGEGPLDVLVDSGQLSGSILNLAINARDAMDFGGTLTIAVERQLVEDPDLDVPAGDYVVISVSDDGSGMTQEVVERAFEPYFSTKGAGHGTGIGLAAVYSFTRQSGGIATLASVRDVGTTITLYLPAVFAEQGAALPVVDRGPTRRVLVVDDENALAGLIAGWLTEQGAEVRVAETPSQAVRVATEFRPDVLLTDVRLGDPDGVDGPTLATEVERILPDIAVVFMTGYSDRMHDLQAQGLHTLAKPFTREALGRVIFPAPSSAVADDGARR